MKKSAVFAVICGALLALAPTASYAGGAAVFNTSDVMSSGALSFQGYGTMSLDPAEIGAYGGVNYGLTNRMDVNATLGLPPGGGDAYFGGDVEFAVLPGQPTGGSFSVVAGAHYRSELGLDGAFVGTWSMEALKIYGAADLDIDFCDDPVGTIMPLNLVVGVQKNLRSNLSLLGELGVNLSDSQNYISVGVVYTP